MIEGLRVGQRRALFALLLVSSFFVPALIIVPLLLVTSIDALAIALIVAGIALPLPVLYCAAKAAVWGEVPGGILTVGLSWWLLSIAVALTNWNSSDFADLVLKAITLDMLKADAYGMWATPAWLQGLGVSGSITVGVLPSIYLLCLLGSWMAHSGRRKRKLAAAVAIEPLPEVGSTTMPASH